MYFLRKKRPKRNKAPKKKELKKGLRFFGKRSAGKGHETRRRTGVFLVITAGLCVIGLVSLVAWSVVLVFRLGSIEISQLHGGEAFDEISKERLESTDKTVILAFEIDRSEGLSLLRSLSIVNLGHWRLDLPVNAVVEIEQGMIVEVSKLYHAGERLSSETSGIGFLVDVIEDAALITVDGYLVLDVTDCKDGDQVCTLSDLNQTLKFPAVWVSTKKAGEGLSRVSANCEHKALSALLNGGFSGVPRAKEVPISKLERASLHGETVAFLRPRALSEAIQAFPADKQIMIEQARVEVYNGTAMSGLARNVTRKLKNSGINVTRTEDAPVTLETTAIFVKDYSDFTYTTDIIKHDLGGLAEIKQENPPFFSAADIVVVMGYNAIR